MLVNFFATETLHAESKLAVHPIAISLDRIAVIILGGGEGKRLSPLTKVRCKPAVAFGGRYTLIDIPISHSLTSGLRKIYVIGQYLAYTLQKHLFQTYFYHGISQNQIQLLVPEEREGVHIWYKGTADAVRQNLDYFSEVSADYFLILSGDQLYNINFQEMIQFALDTDASMVIAAQPVGEKEAKRMGLLKLEKGKTKIIDFVEKPQEQEILDQYKVDEELLRAMQMEKNGKFHLGSMGIYLFKRQALFDLLIADLREDFGKHLIKTQMAKDTIHAYLYDGYWEDIGTIESYFRANLALTKTSREKSKDELSCYDEKNIIMTKSYRLPGAKLTDTKVTESLICEGSIIEAKEITHSIIGVRSIVGKGTIVRDSILMGNEYYERPPLVTGKKATKPGIGVNCVLERVIVDENVFIGDNVKLINKRGLENYDSVEPPLFVRDGIIVIPKGAVIPSNFTF